MMNRWTKFSIPVLPVLITMITVLTLSVSNVDAAGSCGVGHIDNLDGTCTMDFNFVTGVAKLTEGSNSASSTCAATSYATTVNDMQVYLPPTGTNDACRFSSTEWDVSSIPTNSNVTNTVVKYNVQGILGSPVACIWNSLETYPTVEGSEAHYNDVRDGTQYVTSDTNCATIADGYILDLGTNADTDVMERIDDGTNFGVGIEYTSETRVAGHTQTTMTVNGDESVELQVTYIPPSTQDPQDIEELQSLIIDLQNQITSVNATVQDNVTQIDDLYDFWDDLRASIITWLAERP